MPESTAPAPLTKNELTDSHRLFRPTMFRPNFDVTAQRTFESARRASRIVDRTSDKIQQNRQMSSAQSVRTRNRQIFDFARKFRLASLNDNDLPNLTASATFLKQH
jgi:hypothetical protein